MRTTIHLLISLVGVALLASCSLGSSKGETPLIPVADMEEFGSPLPLRAPMQVRDRRFQITQYSPQGDRSLVTIDAVIFPTDVIIIYDPESALPAVFLARSPHGGCLLKWAPEQGEFEDPCYGSRFDRNGGYTFGPAGRDMDRLPARIEGDMILVRPEIIYGEPHQ